MKTQTIVIIITLEEKVEVDYRTAIFGKEMTVTHRDVNRFEITEPTLIVPKNYGGRVEVLPITERTVIHTKNVKRELKP